MAPGLKRGSDSPRSVKAARLSACRRGTTCWRALHLSFSCPRLHKAYYNMHATLCQTQSYYHVYALSFMS